MIGSGRRIEYRDNGNNSNNLKEEENLVVLDQILITDSMYVLANCVIKAGIPD